MAGGQNQAAKTEQQFVQYVGTADNAIISAADWKKVGAEGQESVTWSAVDNQHKVEVGKLSKEALEYLARDSRFKLPKADDAS
jgi:hypothetical protein